MEKFCSSATPLQLVVVPTVPYIKNSFPYRVAQILSGKGLPAICESALGVITFGQSNFDARVTLGTGWTASSFHIGGRCQAATSASGNLSFTPDIAFDRIVVYTLRNTGLGTSTINVDGGSSLGNIVTNFAPAVAADTFNCTLGTHIINISPPTGGNIFIPGIEVYASGTPSVRVFNGGRSGTAVDNWDDTGSYDLYNWCPVMLPDLTVIDLTINDNVFSTALATYESKMTAVINRALTYSDVLLVTGNPVQTGESRIRAIGTSATSWRTHWESQ